MEQQNEFLAAALTYASFGWPVFPLRPRSKHPLTEHGLKDGSIERGQIESWWHTNPTANVGVVTGVKFWALDVDLRHNGIETLDLLESKYGKLPPTIQQVTGSGGRQYFFELAPIKIFNSAGKVGEGIDTRGVGGYVVVPPSIHPDTGRAYDWDSMDEIKDQTLLPAPQWLLQRLNEKPKELSAGQKQEPFPDGQRNVALTSLAGSMRRAGLSGPAIIKALLETNQERCIPPLDAGEIAAIAESVSRYAPGQVTTQQVPKDKEQKQKKEAAGLPFKKATGIIEEFGGVDPYLAAKINKGVLSPWAKLDNEINGLQQGELVIVAGSTSVGKSAFALNYGLHAAKAGTCVVIFSLEMSDVELTDRLLSLAGGVELMDIKKGIVSADDLEEAADLLHKIPLHIVDCPGLNLATMHATIQAVNAIDQVGLVIVDQLQLMSGLRRTENRVQEVSGLSRGLKLAAKECKVPFMVLSHLNRSSSREKRRPELFDLRESGTIEQDANTVLFLHGKNDYSDKPPRVIEIDLIVGKQRHGPRGMVVKLEFHRHLGRFWEKV